MKIYDRRHPLVDGVVAAQVGEMAGVDDIPHIPPNGIAQERIDRMSESARADYTSAADDTPPPRQYRECQCSPPTGRAGA